MGDRQGREGIALGDPKPLARGRRDRRIEREQLVGQQRAGLDQRPAHVGGEIAAVFVHAADHQQAGLRRILHGAGQRAARAGAVQGHGLAAIGGRGHLPDRLHGPIDIDQTAAIDGVHTGRAQVGCRDEQDVGHVLGRQVGPSAADQRGRPAHHRRGHRGPAHQGVTGLVGRHQRRTRCGQREVHRVAGAIGPGGDLAGRVDRDDIDDLPVGPGLARIPRRPARLRQRRIAGRGDDQHALADRILEGRRIEGSRRAQRHVGDRGLLIGRPAQTGIEPGGIAGAVVGNHLHRHDLRRIRHAEHADTVAVGGDQARDVGAVAVAVGDRGVGCGDGEIATGDDPAGQIGAGRVHASVEHGDLHAKPGELQAIGGDRADLADELRVVQFGLGGLRGRLGQTRDGVGQRGDTREGQAGAQHRIQGEKHR